MIPQTSLEVLLLVCTSLTTGFVAFATGPFQKIMEKGDVAAFKKLLSELTDSALKSFFLLGFSLATLLGMIAYWVLYGFGNLWFSAGLILWILTSVISKMTRLPIYERVKVMESTEVDKLKEERRKLHFTGILSLALTLAIIVLMLIGVIGKLN